MLFVDIGEVGAWGRPLSYEKSDKFRDYVSKAWSLGLEPDTVLIDGRFRVACFLYSVTQMRPGEIVIFDDYVGRPHYEIVEKYLLPKVKNGRQALFEVPALTSVTKDLIRNEIDQFRMVMD
jgi:hypothetical protein